MILVAMEMKLQIPVLITKDDPMLWISGKERPLEYLTKGIRNCKAIHLFNNKKKALGIDLC